MAQLIDTTDQINVKAVWLARPIFRDELDTILALCNEYGFGIELRIADWAYDDIEDCIEKIGNRCDSMKIVAESDQAVLNIELSPPTGILAWSGKDAHFLVVKIMEHLKKSMVETSNGPIVRPPIFFWYAFSYAFLFSTFYVLVVFSLKRDWATTLAASSGFVVCLVVLAFAIARTIRYKIDPPICLIRKHGHTSFWRRNKDKIFVGVLLAVFGFLASALLLYLT